MTAPVRRTALGRFAAIVLIAIAVAGCSNGAGRAGSSTESSTPVASSTPTQTDQASVQPEPVTCGSQSRPAGLTRCWQRVLPAISTVMAQMVTDAGGTWEPAHLRVFGHKLPKNPCEESADGGQAGSFYCAKNRTAYMSTFEAGDTTRTYIAQAKTVPGVLAADARAAGVPLATLREGLPGWGQATVLTHELGHQVLVQAGYQQWFDQRSDKLEPGTPRYDAFGFAPETAADCLTGAALKQAKTEGLVTMSAFELWASRAYFAQTDPFNPEQPLSSPFRYRNEYQGEQYRGYGGAYWRLRAFDLGWERGGHDAAAYCTKAAAAWKGIKAVPTPVG